MHNYVCDIGYFIQHEVNIAQNESILSGICQILEAHGILKQVGLLECDGSWVFQLDNDWARGYSQDEYV